MCIVNKCKIRPLFHSKHEKKTLYCLNKYECLSCSYVTTYKSNYSKHLLTDRHLQKNKPNSDILSPLLFACICGKSYKHKSGYHRHKCDKKQSIIYIVDNKRKQQCEFSDSNFENEKKELYFTTESKYECLFCSYVTTYKSNYLKHMSTEKHLKKNNNKEYVVVVKMKQCEFPDCKKIPSYNFQNEKIAILCFQHKEKNMVNIVSKKCAFPDCKKQPIFNLENEKKAIFCFDHKSQFMINVKHLRCKTPLCYTRATEKYEGLCFYCFVNTYPDKPVSRNYKTKENDVVQFIKNTFSEQNWISDRKIPDGCSRRRPDLLLDLGYQIIIVEIDENQHINYGSSCENKRMLELSDDAGKRPIIFIRFNPDDYMNNTKKITSCWTYNKTGRCVVKKSKLNEWDERLLTLKNQIEYWMNPDNRTGNLVEIIHLFYDVV
jgi:hypothetical protein